MDDGCRLCLPHGGVSRFSRPSALFQSAAAAGCCRATLYFLQNETEATRLKKNPSNKPDKHQSCCTETSLFLTDVNGRQITRCRIYLTFTVRVGCGPL